MAVPKNNTTGDTRYDDAACYIHIHAKSHDWSIKLIKTACDDLLLTLNTHKGEKDHKTPEGDNHIKALCRRRNRTFKSANGSHLTPFRADGKNHFGDGVYS